jgi:peptidoglycan/LPS O-acetylase OafA/YrhL
VPRPVVRFGNRTGHADPSEATALALDGVRGIAVLLVLAFHAGREYAPATANNALVNLLRKACSVGWCGVDLFFVLSGFLITGILYRSKSSPAYFRNFYARRILRIFPLYYLILAGSLIYGVVRLSLGYSGSWLGLAGGELALWTYTTNLAIGFSGRWAASQCPAPNSPTSGRWRSRSSFTLSGLWWFTR